MSESIINGIDVNECKYFNKVVNEEPYCNIDEEHLYTCSSDENCYFKQLKRLEQEIEAYQLSENEAKEIIAELKHKNKELKKENEELKEKINIYESSIIANHDGAVGKRLMEVLLALEEIRSYCDEQNLKADYTACYITNRIDEVLK